MAEELNSLISEMRPAFEAFFNELQSSLESFRKLATQAKSAASGEQNLLLVTSQAKEVAAKLHLLKGGSGFLKLHSLHKITAEAEKFFLELAPSTASTDNLDKRLRELIEDLERELNSLAQLLD